ncbi:hypothetical protein C8J57DRAFT_1278315, partial [Mycena rebaudengoi]
FSWALFLRSARFPTISPSISLLFLAARIFCAFPIILHCSYVFTLLYPQAHQDSRLLSPQYAISALEYVLASYLVTDWFQRHSALDRKVA